MQQKGQVKTAKELEGRENNKKKEKKSRNSTKRPVTTMEHN